MSSNSKITAGRGKPRFFCDDKCRQGEFRARQAEGRQHEYRYAGYPTSKRNDIAQKTIVSSTAFKPVFPDRPPPLNILGGCRWPRSIDRKLLRTILKMEVGE